MKIAVVVKDFIPGKGGVERFAYQFVSQSVKRGHELFVLANRWSRDAAGGFSLQPVPALRRPSLAKLISFPLHARRVLQEQGPFDIIFGLTPLFSMDVYRLGEGIHREALLRRYPHPLLRSWKRWGLKSQYLLWMEQRMFSDDGLRMVIAISEASRRQLLRYYRLPQGKATTIYNGVDLDCFHPGVRERYRDAARERWALRGGEMIALFLGNDFRRKGLLRFLHALGLLRARGVKVRGLIGGGDSPGPYRRACRRLGIMGSVDFLGRIGQVEEAYAAADLFVLPTLYDPFGYSCLEALACGLPVITTSYAGASEIIEEGRNGMVVESPEPSSLADAIESIYRQGVWGEMNPRSWETAQNFSLDRNTDAILSLFSRLREAS